jgi:hypothetical protein
MVVCPFVYFLLAIVFFFDILIPVTPLVSSDSSLDNLNINFGTNTMLQHTRGTVTLKK